MAKQNNPLAAIFARVSEPEPAMPEEVWRPYGVFMTPRSGSTWLAELMREAGLGFPNEWLNHARMDREIRERGYTSVKGYLRSVLAEHVGSSGASGIELPLLQVMHAYELEDIFSILGPSARYMFLRRENIVRQAISLYVARESGAYHASDFDLDFVRNPLTVPYDAAAIEDCLQRILHDEVWFERLLSQQKIVPLRLTYEQLQAGAAAVIDRIASHLGVSRVAIADTDPDWSAGHASRRRRVGRSVSQIPHSDASWA